MARKRQGGRPTNSELAQKKIDAAKQARYEAQENRRATRVQIDQNIILYGWMGAIAVGFIASALVSFNGITSVAAYVGLAAPWMDFLFFFFIELMYLLFLVAYLILESRGDKSRGAFTGMIFFAGVSISSNGIHTLLFHGFNISDVTTWVGLVLSVSAPVAIISASKMASNIVFAKAVSL